MLTLTENVTDVVRLTDYLSLKIRQPPAPATATSRAFQALSGKSSASSISFSELTAPALAVRRIINLSVMAKPCHLSFQARFIFLQKD